MEEELKEQHIHTLPRDSKFMLVEDPAREVYTFRRMDGMYAQIYDTSGNQYLTYAMTKVYKIKKEKE